MTTSTSARGRGDVLFLWLCVPGGDDVMLGEIGPDQPEHQAYVEAYLQHCHGKPSGRANTAKSNRRLARKGLKGRPDEQGDGMWWTGGVDGLCARDGRAIQ